MEKIVSFRTLSPNAWFLFPFVLLFPFVPYSHFLSQANCSYSVTICLFLHSAPTPKQN